MSDTHNPPLKLKRLLKKQRLTLVVLIITVLSILSPSHAAGLFGEAATVEPDINTTSEMGDIVDPFGRETPRSTIQGFIISLAEDDAALASNYLDLTPNDNAVVRVRQLKLALDVGGRLNTDLQLSNRPEGNLADKLPPEFEKVGTVQAGDRVIDLLLKREVSPHGNKYWQFAPETLNAIQQTKLAYKPTIVSRYSLDSLEDKSIGGYQLSDIAAVIILTAICLLITYTLVGLLYLVLIQLYPKRNKSRLPVNAKVILPLALVLTSIILSEVLVYAGVSVTIREPVNRLKDIVGWFASTWLLLRMMDVIFNRAERQSLRRNQPERVSILNLLHKVVKALLLILAAIFIFGNLGFDLTTGIAALGVGGLALALGAQKMIENLVGSVVVVADQPVRVGDYCKFGELEGTVIDIGIRSTRIRTLNRTVVTVPNGDFSSMSIENFASRDMFHFLHNLYIRPGLNPNSLAVFLQEMTEFVNNHEITNNEWNQVRIAEMRQDCIMIEVRAYVYATGAQDFYEKQDILLLDVLTEMEKYPVEHALPVQKVVLDTQSAAVSEKHLKAKEEWIKNHD